MKMRKASLLAIALLPVFVACKPEERRTEEPGRRAPSVEPGKEVSPPMTEHPEGTMREPKAGESSEGSTRSASLQATPGAARELESGTATFTQEDGVTKLFVSVRGATPGRYAVQFVEAKTCSAITQETEEKKTEEMDEGKEDRALEGREPRTAQPSHQGTMEAKTQPKTVGQMTVGDDGMGRFEATLTSADLGGKPLSDLRDRAVVIRTVATAPATQGDLVACGVITHPESIMGS